MRANDKGLEILTPDEMAAVEQAEFAAGGDSFRLMLNAGAAVASAIVARFGRAIRADVLCGPGNNGGDGYVVARILAGQGWNVGVWALAEPKAELDAARARAACPVEVRALAGYQPAAGSLVVDALFGGGLARQLNGVAADVVQRVREAKLPVVAVDMPSGVSGATGLATGPHFDAELTVTFMRPRVGHLLYPGRAAAGELVVADIGVPQRFVAGKNLWRNDPSLWGGALPRPDVDVHKYSRGHVAVFSGGPSATGAARLAALAAARAGAGAVTVLSPPDALAANAAHLTSVMLREAATIEAARAIMVSRRVRAAVFGPGLEANGETAAQLVDLVQDGPALVVDASALTAASANPAPLWTACETAGAPLVFTPHEGEFARLFPDISGQVDVAKVEKARAAAQRVHGVLVYKGPDTVIAAPDGRAAINTNGSPWLATAGSGDVLAGMIAGFLAQGTPAFEAACAAVWIHAEAGGRFGPGLIAEDLPGLLPPVLRELYVQ